jgi:hypothetical protein
LLVRLYEHDADSGGLLLKAIRRTRSQEPNRSGLHVSDICDDLLKTLDPKRYEKEINATSILGFQEVGNALEDVIAEALARRIPGWHKPDPRSDDRGVIGSPDGFVARRRNRTIDEVKATWITEGIPERNPFVTTDDVGRIVHESLKFWRYRIQATHYAHMWNAERIRFHILFVNGNYRPPFPNFRTLTLKLTPRDRRDNAHLLWQHAEDRGWLEKHRGRWITHPPQRTKAA